jgi:saccharopine dehydrogenase-like NADP-dependent oxidoreductase
MSTEQILIVGYEVVGRRIANELKPDYPDRVVVAGRNPARAGEIARAIGHGARGRKIDIAVPSSIASALAGVGVVISCIDQPGRTLAVERGLNYTDITPHLTEFRGSVREDRCCRSCVRRSGGAGNRHRSRHLERDGACAR